MGSRQLMEGATCGWNVGAEADSFLSRGTASFRTCGTALPRSHTSIQALPRPVPAGIAGEDMHTSPLGCTFVSGDDSREGRPGGTRSGVCVPAGRTLRALGKDRTLGRRQWLKSQLATIAMSLLCPWEDSGHVAEG